MKRFAILFITILSSVSALSQAVSNVVATQEGNKISVSYSLDKPALKVQLTVSTDGGKTFSQPLKMVSGDVANVQPGRRTILWDVLAEWDKLDGDAIVFNVSAPSSGIDLSASGTANCYIVSAPGTYMFKATVKGGSTQSLDGTPVSASVLWESFGTSTAPSVGSIVSNVSYSDGYVNFSTPTTLKDGNAVIAVKDAAGTILWSWHIWVCDGFDPKATAQVYNNNAGTMMDRNLGATSAAKGDVKSLGFLYQWGRKDPFLSSSSISSNTEAASTLTWPSAVASNSSTGTISYAVAHPTTYITYNKRNYDWYYTGSSSTDNTRWQSSKGIYDPCPKGWQVPDGDDNGVWAKAFGTSISWEETSSNFDSSNRGMDFGSTDKKLGSGTIWYPAAGYRSDYDGSLNDVGYYGCYWSCTPDDGAYSLDFGYNCCVGPAIDSGRTNGWSVRCIKE